MTDDVELLPLPGHMAAWARTLQEDAQTYARANVAHATAAKDAEIGALRVEVDALKRDRESVLQAHTFARERAEQLAEALRDLLSWFPEKPAPSEWRICAGEQGADDAIEYARAALNPTAAQENDDA